MFIHGAVCMGYSGRCILSNYLLGRANYVLSIEPDDKFLIESLPKLYDKLDFPRFSGF